LPARYGVQVFRIVNRDVVTSGEGFALLVVAEDLCFHAERLPVAGIRSSLKVKRGHERVGHFDELVGVEVEIGKDRVEAVGILASVVALQERVGGARDARHISGVDETLSAQRFG
jgi:hypothetical protein